MASLKKLPEWAKIEREQIVRLEGLLYIYYPDGVGMRGPIGRNYDLKSTAEAVAWWVREFEQLRLQREAQNEK